MALVGRDPEGGAPVLEPRLRLKRDSYFIAEQPAPAPQLAHPEGCAALRVVLLLCPVSAALASFFRMDAPTAPKWLQKQRPKWP